jgi:hypothetical protein
MKHPPRLPDLNPDEHVGGMIKRKVQMRRSIITNADDLWESNSRGTSITRPKSSVFFINLI